MNNHSKRFAVFGNPIAHSRSPDIHTQFAAQFGLAIDYQRQQVEPGSFAAAASAFFESGGAGLNITMPFKLDACEFADELSARAQLAGAVNTLIPRNEKIIGDNTDGIGIVRDLIDNHGWQLGDKRVLILGAGGAVRGVLGPILEQQPSQLTLYNRTAEKAQRLIEVFSSQSGAASITMLDTADSSQRFDVVINGTSAAVQGQSIDLPIFITDQAACYDMMYGAEPTAFMHWAHNNGAKACSDGLGMLVEQAAESFRLWLGRQPDTAPVIADIRRQLTRS